MTDLSASEARLWRLVEERTKLGANTEVIDRRIWDMFGEEWAIMFTDLSGFSRQVAKFGIIHFLQIIFEHKQLLLPIVDAHDGILVKIEADSFMILFKQPARALECGIAMQRMCQTVNQRRPAEEQIVLCLGIGFGKILKIGDADVYGFEVNLASKLGEDIAKGHEILVTPAARTQIGEYSGVTFDEYNVDYVNEHLCFRVGYPHA